MKKLKRIKREEIISTVPKGEELALKGTWRKKGNRYC